MAEQADSPTEETTSSSSKYGVFLYSYMIKFGASLIVHGITVDIERERRLGHVVFTVGPLPNVFHLGPFESREQASNVRTRIGELWKVAVRDRPTLEKNISFTTKGCIGEFLLPFAFEKDRRRDGDNNNNNNERIWIEIQSLQQRRTRTNSPCEIKHGVNSIELATLMQCCEDAMVECCKQSSATRQRPGIIHTDRTTQDSVIRLLSPYNLPGFFKMVNGIGGAIVKHPANRLPTMSWIEFESQILKGQSSEEAKADFATLYPMAQLNITIFEMIKPDSATTTPLPLAHRYILNMASCDNRSSNRRVHLDIPIEKIPFGQVSQTNTDLLIVPVKRSLLTNVLQNSVERLGAVASHGAILNELANKQFTSTEKMRATDYFHYPFLLLPIDDDSLFTVTTTGSDSTKEQHLTNWLDMLFIESRVSGLSLEQLAAPFARGIVKTTEATLTRLLFRNGCRIMPSPRRKDGSFGTDHDANNTFAGGFNAPVTKQYFSEHSGHAMMELDVTAFYGTIVTLFRLDFCNKELWTRAQVVLDKYKDMPQGAAATTVDLTAAEFGKEWRKYLLQKDQGDGRLTGVYSVATDGSDEEEGGGDAVVKDCHLPVVTFINKCIVRRSRLLAQGAKGKPQELFLKKMSSLFYGSISYHGNRFYMPLLSSLVTYYGRELILEFNDELLKRCKKARQVMIVTDSLQFRYPVKERHITEQQVARFLDEYVAPRYTMLEFTKKHFTHFLLTERNRFVGLLKVDQIGLPEVVIKGFTPKQKATPPFVKQTLKTFLRVFMQTYDSTTARLDASQPMSKEDVGKLEHAIKRGLEATKVSQQPPQFYYHDSQAPEYFVHMTAGDASAKHFVMDPEEEEEEEGGRVLIAPQHRQPEVIGAVIDFDPSRGFIVSKRKPIKPAGWMTFYLDRSLRQQICKIIGKCFPVDIVNATVEAHFPDLTKRIIAVVAKNRKYATGRNQQQQQVTISTRLNPDKTIRVVLGEVKPVAPDFWTIVAKETCSSSSVTASCYEEGDDDAEMQEEPEGKPLQQQQQPKQRIAHEYAWFFTRHCLSCQAELSSSSPLPLIVKKEEEEVEDDSMEVDEAPGIKSSGCPYCHQSIYGCIGRQQQQQQTSDNPYRLKCVDTDTQQVVSLVTLSNGETGMNFMNLRDNWLSLNRFIETLKRQVDMDNPLAQLDILGTGGGGGGSNSNGIDTANSNNNTFSPTSPQAQQLQEAIRASYTHPYFRDD